MVPILGEVQASLRAVRALLGLSVHLSQCVRPRKSLKPKPTHDPSLHTHVVAWLLAFVLFCEP